MIWCFVQWSSAIQSNQSSLLNEVLLLREICTHFWKWCYPRWKWAIHCLTVTVLRDHPLGWFIKSCLTQPPKLHPLMPKRKYNFARRQQWRTRSAFELWMQNVFVFLEISEIFFKILPKSLNYLVFLQQHPSVAKWNIHHNTTAP